MEVNFQISSGLYLAGQFQQWLCQCEPARFRNTLPRHRSSLSLSRSKAYSNSFSFFFQIGFLLALTFVRSRQKIPSSAMSRWWKYDSEGIVDSEYMGLLCHLATDGATTGKTRRMCAGACCVCQFDIPGHNRFLQTYSTTHCEGVFPTRCRMRAHRMNILFKYQPRWSR
jgi:hypothetical protein